MTLVRKTLLSAVLVVSGLGFSPVTTASANPLPYGADQCKNGYVWREASPADHVCVVPGSRTRAAQDNALADTRLAGGGAYGPNTCLNGFVWREAFSGDLVCVTPATRTATAQENAEAQSHKALAYGSTTCADGYVWRQARPSDHVCVVPESRTVAAQENALASTRFAGGGALGRPPASMVMCGAKPSTAMWFA